MPNTDDLTLYQMPKCPYCIRVFDAMQSLDIEIALRDIKAESKYREELIAATGRKTVPCLRIEENGDTRWMHESLDIVAYLESRFG